jgi:hypothetical protein
MMTRTSGNHGEQVHNRHYNQGLTHGQERPASDGHQKKHEQEKHGEDGHNEGNEHDGAHRDAHHAGWHHGAVWRMVPFIFALIMTVTLFNVTISTVSMA